jgi:hypothetical protein
MRTTPAFLCSAALAGCLALAAPSADAARGQTGASAVRLDEFGRVACGDELARLDNLAIELESDPRLVAYVVVRGPRRAGRKGLSRALVTRMMTYLVKRRGFARGRVVGVDAGEAAEVRGEFWLAPRGAPAPVPADVLRAGRVELPRSLRRLSDCEDTYHDHD